jgi:hypothetical protein
MRQCVDELDLFFSLQQLVHQVVDFIEIFELRPSQVAERNRLVRYVFKQTDFILLHKKSLLN